MEVLVYTHDGKVTKTIVKDFNAKAIAELMADPSGVVAVGDLVLAKHTIAKIVPSKAEVAPAE